MKQLVFVFGGLVAVIAACGDDTTSTIPSPTDAAASSDAQASSSGSSSSSSGSGIADTGAPSGELTAQAKVYCDAVASRKTGCGKGDGVCSVGSTCIYGQAMKPAGTDAYAACFGAPSCKGDDACVDEAGRAVGGAAATDYSTACVKKRGDCPGAFASDFCSPGAFAYTGVGEAAAACLAKACAEVKACLTLAVAPISACK